MIPARRRLALPLIGALLLAACSAGPAAPEPGTTPSATPGAGPTGPGQAQPLDGERLGYPCDLADTPPKLLERNAELLAAAGERLAAGTMADALAFLTAEPDVVEAFGSDLAVTFSIEGAPPAWLVDHSDLGPGETSPSESPAFAMADGVPMPGVVAMPEIQLASVVGDDTTGDGKIDNRDDKRALVLAPYRWQFAPDDESDHVAERLETMTGYEGNVRLKANRTRGAQDVTVEDWLSFDDFDAIFIATHANRECGLDREGNFGCQVIVMTGINLTQADALVGGLYRGFVQVGLNNQSGAVTQLDDKLGMTADSFRMLYPEGLDDTLLVLSACETGLVPGDELAGAISPGGDDFVLSAWTEAVPTDTAFNAAGVLIEQLSLGLTSEEADQAVIEAGFGSDFNRYGSIAALEHISPGGGAVRLVELPTLELNGQPMLDGANLSARVIGTPGDFGSDKLKLDLRLIGISDKSRFSVRYEVDGDPTDGAHDLFFAREGDLPYSYVVQHEVDVGFGVPKGEMELTAIVDLPEGGESRYSVKVNVGGGVTITVGRQTWEFVLHENVGGCGGDDNGFTAFGAVNGDGGGVSFSADLRQGGNIEVSDHLAGAKWMANADRATMTLLNRLPAGQSQIDEITIENSRARGTATFIDTLAVRHAHSTGGPWPAPVGGSFDIQGTTNEGWTSRGRRPPRGAPAA